MKNKTLYKKHMRRFGIACTAYTITIIFYVLALNHLPDASSWRYLVALTPVIPTTFALYHQIQAMRYTDEMQRRIFSEAYIISGLGVGLFTFSYAFLEQVGFPTFNTFFYFPLTVGVWGIANAFLQRSYQ